MAYDDITKYAKFLKTKCEGENHGCGDAECGCCPPGLISIEDSTGNNIGCLTPNDAEMYTKNTYKCSDNLVKTIHPSTGVFIGCLTIADYIAFIDSL